MDQVDNRGQVTTIIHFVFQVGPERLACMPQMPETEFGLTMYHPPVQRTNSPQAVTCPACKRTPLYKRAAGIPDVKVLPENAEK